jgi:hypothetical protein
MRVIKTGITGAPILGRLAASNNSFQSIATNEDIILDPDGTGTVKTESHLQVQGGNAVRILDDNSTNWVGFTAPSSVDNNLVWTLPATDGGNGQIIFTNGSGTLGWKSPAIERSDQTTSTSTFYPVFTDGTSSTSITGVNTSNGKLEFQPSNGRLTVDRLTVSNEANIVMNAGSVNGVPIGASTASTGAFTTLTCTSLTETSSIAYKENVRPIDDALEAISSLVGVVYDRKDGSKHNEAGLIAEEVEKVLPNIVEYKDGKAEAIHYTKLTAYLVEAVKTLTQEVKRLKEGN